MQQRRRAGSLLLDGRTADGPESPVAVHLESHLDESVRRDAVDDDLHQLARRTAGLLPAARGVREPRQRSFARLERLSMPPGNVLHLRNRSVVTRGGSSY